MEAFIKSMDMKAWKAILKGWEHPKVKNASGADTDELKLEEDWTTAEDTLAVGNSKALNALFNGVDKNMFRLIKRCKIAKEAWDILKTSQEGTAKVKISRLQILTRKFENLKMKEDESVHDFYMNVMDFANSFDDLGEKMSDEKIVRKILRSLTKKFDMKVIAMEEAQDISTMRVDELIGSLQTYESSVNERIERKNKSIAFVSNAAEEDEEDEQDSGESFSEGIVMLGRQFNKILRKADKNSWKGAKNNASDIMRSIDAQKKSKGDEKPTVNKGIQCHECEGKYSEMLNKTGDENLDEILEHHKRRPKFTGISNENVNKHKTYNPELMYTHPKDVPGANMSRKVPQHPTHHHGNSYYKGPMKHHGNSYYKKHRRRCHYYGRKGHIRPFCYKLHGYPREKQQTEPIPMIQQEWKVKSENITIKTKVDEEQTENKVTGLIAHTSFRASSKEDWYFDSGCSRHMIGDDRFLVDIKTYSTSYVTFRDEAKWEIIGVGKLINKSLPKLNNVLLVKGLTANLISISQLCDQGLKVNFTKAECLVTSENDELLMKGVRSKDNCYLWVSQEEANLSTCFIAKENEITLWHQKLGHLNLRRMKKAISEEAIRGLPKLQIAEGNICGECKIGKQTKMPHKMLQHSTTTRVLELLHMDLMGPMQVESLGGKRYNIMKNKLENVWKLMGGIELMDVGSAFYMVKFDGEDDKNKVINGGPWMIYDHYLASVLWAIASMVGNPIKVDLHTLKVARGRFARMCVEVDLTKPVVGRVGINGEWYHIQYEGLHIIFTQCGCYGHLMKDCAPPKKKNETAERVRNDGGIVEPVQESNEPGQKTSKPGQNISEPTEKEPLGEPGINGQNTTVENAINGEKIVIMDNNDLPDSLHGDWIKVERKKRNNKSKNHGNNELFKGDKSQPQYANYGFPNMESYENMRNMIQNEDKDPLIGPNQKAITRFKKKRLCQEISNIVKSGPSKFSNDPIKNKGVAKQPQHGGKVHNKFGQSVNNKLCANYDVDQSDQKKAKNFDFADTCMGDTHSNGCTKVEMETGVDKDQSNRHTAQTISIMAEARGFSGGIWIMWNNVDIKVQLIKTDFHFLHVQPREGWFKLNCDGAHKSSIQLSGCGGLLRNNDGICPREGWFKLNCDGAHKSSIQLSGCGGLLRNNDGICVSSFARKIGSCDALHAEMWGMYIGMDLARRKGVTHLQVESDSKVLVDMVTGNCMVNGRIPTLVKRIHDLKNLDWQVQMNHTWREGNKPADWLANFSLTLNSFDLHTYETPPPELQKDATSVDVTNSVSANIVQVQDSDFAAMEERNSEKKFGSFGQDSESGMVQMIPIKTIKPSIEERSIKIGEIDCFLLASESELVAEQKEQGFIFEDRDFFPSYNEERFMACQYNTTFGRKNWFDLPQFGVSDDS
ncbi:hypothetical protein TSUD_286190 [Trifolium subterraneum]|uniref:Uncharacterized protein n=1 Tax=Trifolium subterraneum TaxID=3900 RepID=A0A2Z6NZ59_TRISU|nr:hypothetical protein TSUD_286190 [Trifolium subterraneum]